jgi:hypothetical protein
MATRRRDGFSGWSSALDLAPYWTDRVIPPDIDRERCACLTCAGTSGLCNRKAKVGDRLCEECGGGHRETGE